MPSFSPCAPQGRFPAAFSWPPYREQVSGRCVEFVIAGEESLRRPASARLRWPFLMGPRGPAMDAEGLGGRNSLPTTDPRLRATDPLESKWPSPAPRTAIPCARDAIPPPAPADPRLPPTDPPLRAPKLPGDRCRRSRGSIARSTQDANGSEFWDARSEFWARPSAFRASTPRGWAERSPPRRAPSRCRERSSALRRQRSGDRSVVERLAARRPSGCAR